MQELKCRDNVMQELCREKWDCVFWEQLKLNVLVPIMK